MTQRNMFGVWIKVNLFMSLFGRMDLFVVEAVFWFSPALLPCVILPCWFLFFFEMDHEMLIFALCVGGVLIILFYNGKWNNIDMDFTILCFLPFSFCVTRLKILVNGLLKGGIVEQFLNSFSLRNPVIVAFLVLR